MGDYGAKISKEAQDVFTALDKDLQYSSKFSTLKVLQRGDAVLTTDGSGNGTVTVPHNLGFAPAHFIFRKGTASFSLLDASTYPNAFVPIANLGSIWMGNVTFDVYTTTTDLVIKAKGAGASTTYNFHYLLTIDLAQAFTGNAGITLADGYGLKVSKDGVDVKTGQEYQMSYSQKYRSLQYYDENYMTQALTLPELNSTMFDSPQQAGTYVDFMHGLGYPPFFLCWAYNALNAGQNVLVPFYNNYGNFATGYGGYKAVDGFCDSNRVRISFSEESTAAALGVGGANGNGQILPATTIGIKCIIFTEDLTAI